MVFPSLTSGVRCCASSSITFREGRGGRLLAILSSHGMTSWTCSAANLHKVNATVMPRAAAMSTSGAPAELNQVNNQGLEVLQVLRLNSLQDNPGAVKAKRRKGRGVGSSKGKTCGRGHKGQKAKENIHPLFEGGQTPLYKLLPKRGFGNARHKKDMVPLGLSTLQNYVDMGRIDPSRTVTLHDLLDAGIFKANAVKHGVKLLAFKGEASTVKQPLNILVSRASSQAIAAVESAGGTVTTVHYNRLALRQLLRPHKFLPLPSEDNEGGRGDGDGSRDGRRRRVRQARPPPKFQPYYTSYKNRGYLNPVVQMRNWFQNAEASGNTTSDVDFQQLREAFERSIKGLY